MTCYCIISVIRSALLSLHTFFVALELAYGQDATLARIATTRRLEDCQLDD